MILMILFGYYNYFIILKIQFIIWGAVWVRVGAEAFTPTRVPVASAAGTGRRRPRSTSSDAGIRHVCRRIGNSLIRSLPSVNLFFFFRSFKMSVNGGENVFMQGCRGDL